MGLKCTWTKLDASGKSWGVKVFGGGSTGLSGRTVEVTKKDNSVQKITLGALVRANGREAIYEAVRKPRNGSDAVGDRQPDAQRSGDSYWVMVTVARMGADGSLTIAKEWGSLVSSTQPELWRETGVDVVRTALNINGLLDTTGEPRGMTERLADASKKQPTKAAAPKRPSAARKKTERTPARRTTKKEA